MAAYDKVDFNMTTIEFSKRASSGLLPVLIDLIKGAKKYPIWSAFAVEEIKNRYRYSGLGLVWIVLSFVILVFGLVVFFGGLSGEEGRRFTVYVSLGLVGYQFLMGSLTDACAVFVRSESWIKAVRLPYSIYIYSAILRGLLPLLMQLTTALIISFAVGWRPTQIALLVLPAIFVIVFNAVWVYLFLGIIAARFRDVQHLIGSLGRVLFFATPIFWSAESQSSLVVFISQFNPLTHFLEIFRAPLLGEMPSDQNIIVVTIITASGWVLALITAAIYKRRVPLWVS